MDSDYEDYTDYEDYEEDLWFEKRKKEQENQLLKHAVSTVTRNIRYCKLLTRVTVDVYARSLHARCLDQGLNCELELPNPKKYSTTNLRMCCRNQNNDHWVEVGLTIGQKMVVDVMLTDAFNLIHQGQTQTLCVSASSPQLLESLIECLQRHCATVQWARHVMVPRLVVAISAMWRASMCILPKFTWDPSDPSDLTCNLCRDGAARTIQCTWRQVMSNPDFRVCRNRLQREFDDLHDIRP